jgi:hypothetical protein
MRATHLTMRWVDGCWCQVSDSEPRVAHLNVAATTTTDRLRRFGFGSWRVFVPANPQVVNTSVLPCPQGGGVPKRSEAEGAAETACALDTPLRDKPVQARTVSQRCPK